jgi:membrane-associated protein
MEFLKDAFDLFLHLDKHLAEIVEDYGAWTHGILFLIIFCETGLVVTPFLPGDSLLFAAGIFAGAGLLDVGWLMLSLTSAAILGDAVNYSIGFRIGQKLLDRPNSRIFKKEYIDRTHAFYEKYGGKTIIIARFVPIIRTFAPFLAGVGRMNYFRFAIYNVTGAIIWVTIGVLAGYFFGGTDFVKENFTLMILLVIIVSLLPGLYEYIRHRMQKKEARAQSNESL